MCKEHTHTLRAATLEARPSLGNPTKYPMQRFCATNRVVDIPTRSLRHYRRRLDVRRNSLITLSSLGRSNESVYSTWFGRIMFHAFLVPSWLPSWLYYILGTVISPITICVSAPTRPQVDLGIAAVVHSILYTVHGGDIQHTQYTITVV